MVAPTALPAPPALERPFAGAAVRRCGGSPLQRFGGAAVRQCGGSPVRPFTPPLPFAIEPRR
jgi:hypothetical protein